LLIRRSQVSGLRHVLSRSSARAAPRQRNLVGVVERLQAIRKLGVVAPPLQTFSVLRQ